MNRFFSLFFFFVLVSVTSVFAQIIPIDHVRFDFDKKVKDYNLQIQIGDEIELSVVDAGDNFISLIFNVSNVVYKESKVSDYARFVICYDKNMYIDNKRGGIFWFEQNMLEFPQEIHMYCEIGKTLVDFNKFIKDYDPYDESNQYSYDKLYKFLEDNQEFYQEEDDGIVDVMFL